jgi:hypothetical protein
VYHISTGLKKSIESHKPVLDPSPAVNPWLANRFFFEACTNHLKHLSFECKTAQNAEPLVGYARPEVPGTDDAAGKAG